MSKRFFGVAALCLTACLLSLSGCGGNPSRTASENSGAVRVKAERSGKAFLSGIGSMELIPLEMLDGKLLGGSVQLSLFQGEYLLTDRRNARIQRYSAEGRFINEIGRKGNGSDEYVAPRSVQVLDGAVHVFDSFGKEIVYDADGNCLSKSTVPFGLYACRYDGGLLSYYGYSGQREYRLVRVADEDGQEEGFLPLEANLLSLDMESEIFSPASGGGICFVDAYSPVVYAYQDGTVGAHVSFDFGKYAIPASFFKSKDVFVAAEELMAMNYAVVTAYSEDDSHKLVQCLIKEASKDQGWGLYGLYDEERQAWTWFSLADYAEDAFPGPLRFVDGGILYGLFTADELRRLGKAVASDLSILIGKTLAACDPEAYVVAKIVL